MKKFILIFITTVTITTIALQSMAKEAPFPAFVSSGDLKTLNYLSKKTNYFAVANADSCLFYAKKGRLLANQLKQPLIETGFLTGISFALRSDGDYINALQTTLFAIKLVEDTKSETKADLNFSQVLLSEKVGSAHDMRLFLLGKCNNFLGSLYFGTGNRQQGFACFLRAKHIAEQHKYVSLLMGANANIGFYYLTMHKVDSAMYYTQKAISLSRQYNMPRFMASYLRDLGKEYLDNGNAVEAKRHLLSSIKAAIENNTPGDLPRIYATMSSLFFHTKQIDSAIHYGRKSLALAETSKIYYSVYAADTLLSSIFKNNGQTDSAYKHLIKSVRLKEILDNQRNDQQFLNISFNDQLTQEQTEAEQKSYRNRVRLYLLVAGLLVFFVFAIILLRNNRQRRKANLILNQKKNELESTLQQLTAAQAQLIQSEKMASLGELTAGIAHEIQNPLNFVINFSEVTRELLSEMKDELAAGNMEDVTDIAADIDQNLEKIHHHGKRADSIVKGMLEHSRVGTGTKEATDINNLADEYFRLAHHGLQAKDETFNVQLITDLAQELPPVSLVPLDIGRVLLNLFNNAFYAIQQKQKIVGTAYKPTVEIHTAVQNDSIIITVKDNGIGVPDAIKDKIMQPFFTTKPTGEGTGLGLSISYDIIVKGYGGKLNVDSQKGEGSKFSITIPIANPQFICS